MKWIAASWVLFAAACSGGGETLVPPQVSGPLEIQTESLNPGNVGFAYVGNVAAAGGQPPYSYTISGAGDPLPAGLTLTGAGQVVGTPTTPVAATVIISAQDAAGALDVKSLPVEVRDVEIIGGPGGNLAHGQTVNLAASGGAAGYAFSLTINQSGANLAGGSYTSGNTPGVDVVRATDADGFFEEVALPVGSDAFVGFVERFGATDVWWVNWNVVYDPSPTFATDYDEVLVALGLRDPSSTDAVGNEADQLARDLAMRRTLGWLSTYFGNGDDGNPLPGGLDISIVKPSGPASGSSPGPTGAVGAAPFLFSQICVRWGPTAGVVGTAWLDFGNGGIEHNCGDTATDALGVFANRILAPYLQVINNSISSNPVGPGDVAALRSMLQGNAPTNAREQAIYDVANEFGRITAAVLAHEIGHSLGLGHSDPSDGDSDIMNASLAIRNGVLYAFNADHWTQLAASLPGPNR